MKYFKKLYTIIIIFILSVALMSFIPLKNSNKSINNDSNELLTPSIPSPTGLHVGWKEVNVNYRLSGNYYVIYSDIVDGLDPDHTITWGCGSLDLVPETSGWDCIDNEEFFTAYSSEGCEYIYIHSKCIPDAEHPLVTHTINIKVSDDQGEVSNAGGITFKIHYTPNPSSGEPTSPCGSF